MSFDVFALRDQVVSEYSNPTNHTGPGAPINREKLPKTALVIGIGPFSGVLRLAQTRTNAVIFGGCGERGAKARLAAGANWI
jgi:hypothetical protein